ncbi:MAG: protein kinase [Sandaracinaceae bacterium]
MSIVSSVRTGEVWQSRRQEGTTRVDPAGRRGGVREVSMTEPRNRRTWALAQLGRTLGGRYRIDALRGTGGMGAVFEGTHLHVDRKVAIKLLFPESSSDAEALQREAKHAASIPGQGVVAITDFDFAEEGAFLVMELLEGRSLADRLKDGALLEAETRSVVGDVLETLDAVHAAGLVHGDLKPSNVFLVQDGPTKLLDFGVARSIGTDDARVRGTPAYMAPEQLEGSVDPRSDLYAVGALAFEALSGRRPYADRDTPRAVVDALREGPPPGLHRWTGVSEAARGWVERAMSRDPEARFRTALEMLDAVDLSADGPPGSAASAFRAAVQSEEAVDPKLRRPTSRRWLAWTAGLGLAFGALTVGVVGLWPVDGPAPPRAAEATPPSPPSAPSRPEPARPEPARPESGRLEPALAEQAPLPVGSRVIAPFGPRFRFPGTVVEDNGAALRVVFADGDVSAVPRSDVTHDRLVPGACVLRRQQRTGVRACITQRVQHAVRITSPDGPPRWTSVMHLFVDPSAPSPGLSPFEPVEVTGTGPGARVWSQFRGGAEDFAGVVVERDADAPVGPRVRVVYFDGDTEWVGETSVRPFELGPGAQVRAAPRRTAMVDPDVGRAIVQEVRGEAVRVALEDGRQAWVALGQLAVPHP